MEHQRSDPDPARPGPTRRGVAALLAGGTALLALGTVTRARAASLADAFRPHAEGQGAGVDHGAFARFLDAYLLDGPDGVNRVAYGRVTNADRAALKAYIAALGATDIAALSRNDQFAFWANLYNAVTLEVVLEAWPVGSIREIKPTLFSIGSWKKEVVTVGSRKLSLDDIEHGIMRTLWDDPRVHYAVNCASIGCPNLQREPLQGTTLDAQLDAWAREYVNHPRGARVDARGRLTVSRIYKWYDEDFSNSERGVIAHLKRHAGPELQAALERVSTIAGYEYDWSINAPAAPGGSGHGGN